MGWLQLETDLGTQQPDEIEDLLESLGAVAITLRDGGDHPLLEPSPGETPVWPEVILTALFPDDFTEQQISGLLKEHLPADRLSFKKIEGNLVFRTHICLEGLFQTLLGTCL